MFDIRWPKDQRATAKAAKKGLVAYAADYSGGRYEFKGPCDNRACDIILFFAMRIHHGKSLDEAYKETKKAVRKLDAKLAAKAAKASATENGGQS